jgi:hypothetical protein
MSIHDIPRTCVLMLVIVGGLLAVGNVRADEPPVSPATDPPAKSESNATPATETESSATATGQSLFDGQSLDGWKVLDEFSFKRHGEVRVEDGHITFDAGAPATGIAWQGEPPRGDYELTLEAMRVEGHDFFCGLTFPVGESHCTLILGGWGGSVVGLSNVDDLSAIENQTTDAFEFENGRWYAIRLRVTADRIAAWIDDRQIVDLPTKNRRFGVWWEQEPARPLGITTWYTQAAVRAIRLSPIDDAWTSLFDGEELGEWKRSDFGGAGDVSVADGRIEIGFCDGCNGVTWTGEFPTIDYELRLEAMRVDGIDFFCGLTFPVGDDPCSLIVGGWGGAVVGLSSIDGLDAARNETKRLMGFSKGRWYAIRLRVTGERIQAWIDEQPVVDLPTKDRRISIRPEVNASRPLGIASWCTTAAIRGLEWRPVKPAQAASADETSAPDSPRDAPPKDAEPAGATDP